MTGILFSLIILVCILLVLVVLIQKPKGGGLTASMSAPSQIIGVARSSDVVEKITWGLVIALLVLSIGMNLGIDRTVAAADGTEQTTTTNSVEKNFKRHQALFFCQKFLEFGPFVR